MKNFSLKTLLPHLIAIGIFLIVTVVFCKPALESGVVLKQSDISGWQGMSHQSMLYKEQHGHFPLWVTSMFGGMPAYQIAVEGHWNPMFIVSDLMQLWLPKPMNFFFLACVCFYILAICLRLRSVVGIFGAISFAYSLYNPIIVSAGHDTKMLALAWAPAAIGAAILLFERRYLVGFALAAFFMSMQIAANHQQISYYLFIILALLTVSYGVRALKAKQLPGFAKGLGLLFGAGLIAIAFNALSIFPNYDYAKESKRGGQLVMDDTNKAEKTTDGKTTGLSKAYAFQWSYGIGETFSLIFPGAKGYGLHYAERDGNMTLYPKLSEDAKSVTTITDVLPQAPADQLALQMSQSVYWGDQPFTNGPVYLGAIVCMLFLLSMFSIGNTHKWWILGASVLGILLSWGSNLPGFNGFMFDYVPFYNKFRVPTMAMVIPQLLFPIAGMLFLNLLFGEVDELLKRNVKRGFIAVALVFAAGFAYYASSDFSNENRARTTAFSSLISKPDADMQRKYAELNAKEEAKRDNKVYEEWMMQMAQQGPQATETAKAVLSGLRADRKALFLHDILIALLFVAIAGIAVWFRVMKNVNVNVVMGLLFLLNGIDLLGKGSNYLDKNSYADKSSYEEQEFPKSAADEAILADKDPNFRVFNTMGGDPFQESKTSYYHKSIGGYHAAKLGIYDDLAMYQMSGNLNPAVLNMLNTKYVITKSEQGGAVAQRNPGALGNAWFIKGINFVKGPVAEMKGLDNLNTQDSAVADESFRSIAGQYSPADSASVIKQTAFDNDAITYQSVTSKPQIAVFSEIWYKDWKAYIDGKPADYFRVNYVLRALNVPAGSHTIEFKYEPKIFFASKTVAGVAGWFLFGLLVVCAFLFWRNESRTKSIAP